MSAALWPCDLGRPVDPIENTIRARAQSILTGSLIGGVCPPLTIEQARTVIAWHQPITYLDTKRGMK